MFPAENVWIKGSLKVHGFSCLCDLLPDCCTYRPAGIRILPWKNLITSGTSKVRFNFPPAEDFKNVFMSKVWETSLLKQKKKIEASLYMKLILQHKCSLKIEGYKFMRRHTFKFLAIYLWLSDEEIEGELRWRRTGMQSYNPLGNNFSEVHPFCKLNPGTFSQKKYHAPL